MLHQIQQLNTIANKQEKIILGLMSGTSLDGLDMALCRVSGNGINTRAGLIEFETYPYPDEFIAEVKTVFSKEQVSLQQVCLLNNYTGQYHSEIINTTLAKWKVHHAAVDIIASHGQTIYHAPKQKHQLPKFGNATLQIGDADQIAFNTGIITISDFRQKHIAAGGEGAPLAVYGDYFLCSNETENRILLNIGGIANLAFLPSSRNFNEVLSTDIGAGNTLMDAYIQQHFPDRKYDKDASVALQGMVNEDLLNALCNHPFFELPFPKTTGQELFNLNFIENALQASNTKHLNYHNVMATLNFFTAKCIADAIKELVLTKDYTVYASGGGVKNKLLMQHLQQLLPQTSIHTTDILGIHPDAKEAILFAVLANECVCGNRDFYAPQNLTNLAISMGKISFPR